MKVALLSANGLVKFHEQEVIFSGRMPDLIRWNDQYFAHQFTNWPKDISAYRQVNVFDMPEPLMLAVSCPPE